MGWHISQCQDDFLEAQAFHSTSNTYTHNNNKQNKTDEQISFIFSNTKASLFKLWTRVLVLQFNYLVYHHNCCFLTLRSRNFYNCSDDTFVYRALWIQRSEAIHCSLSPKPFACFLSHWMWLLEQSNDFQSGW